MVERIALKETEIARMIITKGNVGKLMGRKPVLDWPWLTSHQK